MAQSRLEKIGSIFSRLQGLRKSGAIKAEQVLGQTKFSRPHLNPRCPCGQKYMRHFHHDMNLGGMPRILKFPLGKFSTEKIVCELNIARYLPDARQTHACIKIEGIW